MASPDAISAALKLWGIEADSVETLAGWVNDVVLVRTGDQGYVLRAAIRRPPLEQVNLRVRFAEFLNARGFPAASPIRTTDGVRYAVLDGIPWTLETLIAGSTFDFGRIGQAREAGRRLAQFQQAAEPFEAPSTQTTLLDLFDDVLDPNKPGQLHRMFDGRGFDDELAYFSDWHAGVIATPWRQRLDTLPQSWLHGDYHGRNMVFGGDTMAGLFDFDDITRGPRIFDVAKGFYAFSRERRPDAQSRDLAWSVDGEAPLTLRADFASAFLDAYEAGSPLTAAEREALPFVAVIVWAPMADFYESRRADEGIEYLTQRLRRDIRMMRGVASEMQRLAVHVLTANHHT